MNFSISEIKDKNDWENFLLGCREKTFLNSWNWGEFQKKQGNAIWRLGVYEDGRLAGVSLVIKILAKRGTFLFLPHGPVIQKSKCQNPNVKSNPNVKIQIFKKIAEELKELAKKENTDFIRISPIWEKNPENDKIFRESGFRRAPIHMHPEVTWELDIEPSEDKILSGMRKTTRYLIKQAQKNKDIEITKSRDVRDLETFNDIYVQTARRHHFVPFSFSYLKNELLSFDGDNEVLIFTGKYKGKAVSSAMIIFWQGAAFYHQGASLSEFNKIPVSYLLQWEVIKEAKRRGCRVYNFWGIVPRAFDESQLKHSKHPWAGLSLFKMGFGGARKEYVATQDLPLFARYYLTYFFEKIRRIKRGL